MTTCKPYLLILIEAGLELAYWSFCFRLFSITFAVPPNSKGIFHLNCLHENWPKIGTLNSIQALISDFWVPAHKPLPYFSSKSSLSCHSSHLQLLKYSPSKDTNWLPLLRLYDLLNWPIVHRLWCQRCKLYCHLPQMQICSTDRA
jgi:hypothetical protein